MRKASELRYELQNNESQSIKTLIAEVTNIVEIAHNKGETSTYITREMRTVSTATQKAFALYVANLGYSIVNYSDYRESSWSINWY